MAGKVDDMLCRWASHKYGLGDVDRVIFSCNEGWVGTDVTPGDPASFAVVVYTADGHRREFEDLEYVPEVIREIAAFAVEGT